MTEQKKSDGESLVEALCGLAETGALVVEELISSLKPPEEECQRFKKRFWELQSKLATGLSAIAEHRLRDLQTPSSPSPPTRHADPIIVEEDT